MSEDAAREGRSDELDIDGIQQLLPHRYPFLLIDRVVEILPGQSAVGIKNVSVNEPYFMGHFPNRPIMPGVLIVEAMAQTAALVVMAGMGGEHEQRLVYFRTIDQARFRRPVLPGDQLRIKVEKQQQKLGVWKFAGRATVDAVLVAEAIVSAKIVTL
jgi:3-hydroxyacyl-[acyl-carrier-protein] dehydratase